MLSQVASPSVEVVEKSDERIVVRFNNTPRQYVNSLRRLAISEVPTLAIDDVVILENSSVMHDEAVAHRLGLIPLRTDPARFVIPHECDCKSTLGCSKCRVLLVLDTEANEKTLIVTSGELVSEDEMVKPVSHDIAIIVRAPNPIGPLPPALKKNQAAIWRALEEALAGPRANRREINVRRLAKVTKASEVVVIPGKILGSGSLGHKQTVCAF